MDSNNPDCLSPLSPAGYAQPEQENVLISSFVDEIPRENILEAECRLTRKVPAWLRLRDKLVFTYAASQIPIGGMLFSIHPIWFTYVYTVKLVLYNILRFITYREKKYHYFLLDFCYFANIFIIFHIWLAPSNRAVAAIAWSFATGPLLFAIPMWSNALVFHSMDKISSVFIHMYPIMVMYHRRFWGLALGDFSGDTIMPPADGTAPMVEFWLRPFLAYLGWMAAYIIIVFGIRGQHVRSDPDLLYSVNYCAYEWSLGRRVCGVFGERGRVPMYFALQALYTAITLAATAYLWRSALISGLIMLFGFVWAAWNGAGYYMGYFARVYEKSLQTRRDELATLARVIDDPDGLAKARGVYGRMEGRVLLELIRRENRKQRRQSADPST